MQSKWKALAWVALYMAIAIGLEVLLAFVMIGAMTTVAVTNGLVQNQSGFMQYWELALKFLMRGSTLIIITAAADVIYLICFGLWYYFRETTRYTFRPDYRRAFTLKNILCVAGIGFFGQYAINLIMLPLPKLLPGIYAQYEKMMKLLSFKNVSPVFIVIVVCVIGPIAEEMIFRGMVYGKLRRAFSVWPAALISGLLFGIFHMNWIQGMYATIFGVVLAYVYEKTQTIWGSCLLHAVFNSSSYIIEETEVLMFNGNQAVILGYEICMGIAGAVLVILFMRHFREKRIQTFSGENGAVFSGETNTGI